VIGGSDPEARLEALLSDEGRTLLDRLAAASPVRATGGGTGAAGTSGAAEPADGTEFPGPTGPAGRAGLPGERGGSEFALATALRREFPADLVAAALAQHELRGAARAKFARASRMFLTRPGLEQASPESVARLRARRFSAAGRIADLCTGIGGDLIALAATGPVLAVDLDPVHLRMARLNARAYGVADAVRAVCADVRTLGLTGIDAAFVDPARRAGGRRLRAGEYQPELSWCLDLAERVPAVGVKAAPGISRELVPAGWELEFVAVGRDLKEAVLWSPPLATARRRATVLTEAVPPGPGSGPGDGEDAAPIMNSGQALHEDSVTLIEERGPEGGPFPDVEVKPPGGFLYDPNPAVTRAGLVEALAAKLGAWKIDEQIAFLSTERSRSTPFARTLRVVDSLPWHHRTVGARLRELGIGLIDIRRRGLAGDVSELRRRLRPRGSRRGTVVMTRVGGRPWALICTDPNLSG
jgi:hypothetical protein